jgi:hypothetical protein
VSFIDAAVNLAVIHRQEVKYFFAIIVSNFKVGQLINPKNTYKGVFLDQIQPETGQIPDILKENTFYSCQTSLAKGLKCARFYNGDTPSKHTNT